MKGKHRESLGNCEIQPSCPDVSSATSDSKGKVPLNFLSIWFYILRSFSESAHVAVVIKHTHVHMCTHTHTPNKTPFLLRLRNVTRFLS